METCEEIPADHDHEHDHGYMVPDMVPAEPTSQRSASNVQPDCLLSIGSQCLAAAVSGEEERDDTALHVLVQGNPLFWVDDAGMLQTPEVEIEVRVTNILRIEAEEDDLGSNLPVFSIGLDQINQPAVKLRPSPAAPTPEAKPRPKLLSRLPLIRIRLSLGTMIALALVATPLIVVAALWRYHVYPIAGVESSNPVVDAPVVPTPAPSIQQPPAAPRGAEVSPEILRLPGVGPFLNPDVAKKLKLTPSQMGAFGRLDKTTQEALTDLEKYWETPGRLELARRQEVILEAAREEALQVLTDWQREQWQSMTR